MEAPIFELVHKKHCFTGGNGEGVAGAHWLGPTAVPSLLASETAAA